MFVALSRRRLRGVSIVLVALHVLSLAPVFANPRGGSVVSGGATIHEDGALLTVRQSTDRAIINWQGFSNAAGETVRFEQPAATSAVLNRVTGAERSVIDGALQSNGRVFLLNRNGILFGKTANVNTAGLVASTLEMSDEDFRAGRHKLSQDPGSPMRAVVNQGHISTPRGGQVALVAPIVDNQGTISAPEGRVALAAGAQATVTLDGAGLVTLGVRDGAPGAVVLGRDAVSNVLEQAVNNRHLVDAGSSSMNGKGEVVLGGAEGIALNQGTIRTDSVTANTAAGRVRVDSTQFTGLARSSLISANGGAGDSAGGDVRVMSQGKTLFNAGARLEAKGGETGDGGFVEVSAPRVWVNGDVSTRGASGKAGTFLIDPTDITIVNGAAPQGDDDTQLALCGGAPNGNNTNDDGTINSGDLAACSLTISEGRLEDLAADGNNILLQATNSIVVCDLADGVLNLSGVGVSLQAGTGGISFADTADQILAASIEINANVFGAGALSLGRLQATVGNIDLTGTGIAFNGVVDAGAGEIHITSAGAVTQTAGANLLAGGLSLSGAGTFTLTAGTNAVTNIASNATGAVDYKDDAALVVNAVNAICGITTGGANVTLEADAISINAVTINAGAGAASLIANTTGIVTNNGICTDISAGTISLKAVTGIGAGCGINTATTGSLTVETTGAGATVAVDNSGSNASSITLRVNDAATTASVLSNGGSVTLAGSTLDANTFCVLKPDLTFVSGSGALSIGNIDVAGKTVSLSSGGAATQGASAITANRLELLGGGSFALASGTNDVNRFGGTVAGAVSFTDANGFALDALSASSVTLTSNGTVTQCAPITTATLSLGAIAAGNGVFTLNTQNNAIGTASTANQVLVVQLRDDANLALGNLSAAATVTLQSNGAITQCAATAIVAPSLAISGAGSATLDTSVTNDVTTLAANLTAGGLRFRDVDDLILGIVAGTTGVTVFGDTLIRTVTTLDIQKGITNTSPGSGTVLQAGGAVTQSAGDGTDRLLVQRLSLRGTGTFTLDEATNDATSLSSPCGTTGAIVYVDANGLDLGDGAGETLATSNASVSITAGGATVIQEDVNVGTGNLTLNIAGALTQQACDGITAAGLELLGAGAATLTNPCNNVGTLAANKGGAISYRDANALTVGTVNTVGVQTANANISLETGGNLTVNQKLDATTGAAAAGGTMLLNVAGAISQAAAGGIQANGLEVLVTGNGLLCTSAVNDVATLAVSITGGSFAFVDANDLVIGTVGGTNGINGNVAGNSLFFTGTSIALQRGITGSNTSAINLTTRAGGTATQCGDGTVDRIVGDRMGLIGPGTFVLTAANNDLNSVVGIGAGPITYNELTSVNLGFSCISTTTVAGSSVSITAGGSINVATSTTISGGGTLTLDAAGSITQAATGVLLATNLEALAGNNVLLFTANNDVGTLAARATTGGIQFNDVNALTVGTAGATSGLNGPGGGDITVQATSLDLQQGIFGVACVTGLTLITRAGGSIVQSAVSSADRIVADRLNITGPGTATLTDAANDLNAIGASSSGAVTYTDVDGVNLGFGGIQFITAGGTNRITATGAITITDVVNVGAGTLALTAGGAITQGAGDTITAAGLKLAGAGSATLADAGNAVGTLAAATCGAVSYRDGDALAVGTVDGTTGIALAGANLALVTGGALSFCEGAAVGAANVTLDAGGAVTQATGKTLSGSGLELLGAGPVTLGEANAFTTIAASTGGSISYRDADALAVGTVNTAGVTSAGAVSLTAGGSLAITNALAAATDVALTSGGCITQTAGITGQALKVVSTGLTLLCGAGNNVATVAGTSCSAFLYTDADNVQVGTVLGTSGITSNGDLRLAAANLDIAKGLSANGGNAMNLTVSGTASQSAPDGTDAIVAERLFLIGPGAFTLDEATNDVNAVSTAFVATGAIVFRDANDLDLGRCAFSIATSNASATFQAGGTITLVNAVALGTGDLTLISGGAITQNGGATVTANGLRLSGAGAATLGCAANNVALIASNRVGATSYTDADVLAVGTANGVTGIASSGSAVDLTAAGTLSVGTGVNAGAGAVTLTSTGGAITDGNDAVLGDGTVDVTGGAVTLSGATGVGATGATAEIEISATSLAASTGGAAGQDIFVNNLGAAPLGLGTVDAGGGAVSLKSTGSMIDGNDPAAGTLNVRGASVTLASAGAIGAPGVCGEIEVQTASLTATSGGGAGQGIFLANLSACSFALGTLNAGAGDLTFRTQGAITDGNDTVPGVVNLTGASVTLIADGGIGATGVCGEIEIASTTLAATVVGDVFLFETNGTALGLVTSGAANFSLRSGGALTDGNGAAVNVVANQATIQASGAVGSVVDPLETTVASLAVTSGGDVGIQETDSVVLGNVIANAGTGVARLGAAGAVTQTCATSIQAAELRAAGGAFTLTGNTFGRITGTVSSLSMTHASNLAVSAAGQTFLSAGAVAINTTGDLLIGGDGVCAAGAAVTLTAASISGAEVGAGTVVANATGNIALTADAGQVAATSTGGAVSVIDNHLGGTNVSALSAASQVTFAHTGGNPCDVLAFGAVTGGGLVSLTATGGTMSFGADVTSATEVRVTTSRIAGNSGRLTGPSVNLVTTGDLGSAAASVRTDADTLSATSTGGSVFLAEDDALVVTQLAAAQNAQLVTGGDVFVNAMTGVSVNLVSGGSASLNSLAGSGVAVTAVGAINDANGAVANIQALTIALDGASIGTAGGPLDVDAGTSVSATARTGGAFLRDPNALSVGTINAAGAVGVTAGGALSVGSISSGAELVLGSGGNLTMGTATAAGPASVTAVGDIVDDNGTAANLTAGATTLRAGGVIGTFADPFDVSVAAPLRVAAGGIQQASSIALAGTIGGGARPELLDGTLPGLGIFNGLIFFPFADQGNAAVALATLAVGGVSLRVFDGSQFTLGADLIQNEAGEDEESEAEAPAEQSTGNGAGDAGTGTSDSGSEEEARKKKAKESAKTGAATTTTASR